MSAYLTFDLLCVFLHRAEKTEVLSDDLLQVNISILSPASTLYSVKAALDTVK